MAQEEREVAATCLTGMSPTSHIADDVVELIMSVARSRLIRIVGVRSDGSRYERHLYVNQNGKLQLL
jgi:hypothetical protein